MRSRHYGIPGWPLEPHTSSWTAAGGSSKCPSRSGPRPDPPAGGRRRLLPRAPPAGDRDGVPVDRRERPAGRRLLPSVPVQLQRTRRLWRRAEKVPLLAGDRPRSFTRRCKGSFGASGSAGSRTSSQRGAPMNIVFLTTDDPIYLPSSSIACSPRTATPRRFSSFRRSTRTKRRSGRLALLPNLRFRGHLTLATRTLAQLRRRSIARVCERHDVPCEPIRDVNDRLSSIGCGRWERS